MSQTTWIINECNHTHNKMHKKYVKEHWIIHSSLSSRSFYLFLLSGESILFDQSVTKILQDDEIISWKCTLTHDWSRLPPPQQCLETAHLHGMFRVTRMTSHGVRRSRLTDPCNNGKALLCKFREIKSWHAIDITSIRLMNSLICCSYFALYFSPRSAS